ncbi:NUDIX domain-containing protein, partial [Zhongshania guokunii]
MSHFCYECGHGLELRFLSEDERFREQCPSCGYIHYLNPKIQVTVVAQNGCKILWMQRATEPGIGRWALPGGFMELGESLREASARELREETGLDVDPQSLRFYVLGNLTNMDQVHILFNVNCIDPVLSPGCEALAVKWFSEEEAPWQHLAFPKAEVGLRLFYRDIQAETLGLYYAEQRQDALYLKSLLRSV